MSAIPVNPADSRILFYQTDDSKTRLEVRLQNETVWLTQAQMAELFETSIPNVSMHIKSIFQEGELTKDSVLKEFLTTAADGKSYRTNYYNLDVIISVGYRVKSLRGTQFRIWATHRLREFIVKGFALDDERLKEGNRFGVYFDELLARIRDIRASEKNFYRKIQDIYSTSIDYDPGSPVTEQFFAMVQNKLHWAVVGKTAAEIIVDRAGAAKPHMGLTSWKGANVRKADVTVAKNYLSGNEIEILNLLVSQYLDFAELQARSQKAMYMKDWAAKLDAFLRVNDLAVLEDAGRISHALAEEIASREYGEYLKLSAGDQDSSPFHPDFENAVKQIFQLPATKTFKKPD